MEPRFDRFDICEAYWLFLSQFHEGQGSPLYARLSRMTRYFSPRPTLHRSIDLTDNGRAIYQRLVVAWTTEQLKGARVALQAVRKEFPNA